MRARTISAIKTEANYIRHRMERVLSAMDQEEEGEGCKNSHFAELQDLRCALNRCDVEMRSQSQTAIDSIGEVEEFSLA